MPLGTQRLAPPPSVVLWPRGVLREAVAAVVVDDPALDHERGQLRAERVLLPHRGERAHRGVPGRKVRAQAGERRGAAGEPGEDALLVVAQGQSRLPRRKAFSSAVNAASIGRSAPSTARTGAAFRTLDSSQSPSAPSSASRFSSS